MRCGRVLVSELWRVSMFMAFVCAATGCSGGSLSAPTAVSQPARLIIFTDSVTSLSTSDVYDAQDRIVRFNAADELIWTADETRYKTGLVIVGDWVEPILGFPSSGNFVGAARCPDSHCKLFEVRFGTRNGERRANLTPNSEYFHSPNQIAHVEIQGTALVVTSTSMQVPGS